MMTEDTVADLKQFIGAAISQQTADLRRDIRRIDVDIVQIGRDLKSMDKRLNHKIDTLSLAIGDVLDAVNAAHDAQFKDLDRRVTRLERKNGLVGTAA